VTVPDVTEAVGPSPASEHESRTRPSGASVRQFGGQAWQVARMSAVPAGIFLASRLGVLLVLGALGFDLHHAVSTGLYKWDSGWYVRVAEHGYPRHIPSGTGAPAQTTLAFFPLLPLAVRAAAHLTGLTYTRSGLLVAFVGGLLGAIVLWWLLRDITDRRRATQGTALVLFCPAAFILSMIYTESLLIPLVAGALLALRRRWWLVAGILAGLATAVDVVASAIIIACAVAAAQAIHDRREWRSLVAPLLAPMGLVSFFGYLWVHTGTPLAYVIDNKRGWQRGQFFHAVGNEVMTIIHRGYYPNDTFNLAGFGIFLILFFLFVRGRPTLPVFAYVVTVVLIALPSPVLGFSPRVLLGAFPLFGIVGARLPRGWIEVVVGLSATAMAALAFVTLGSTAYVP
jgi:Mannosyltransferase (PIG-V)